MVNTNKILTVSYGTFSCTLEGFEDSFGTMTRIAEYFQRLSANDRYFGAEPPTPDAEELARIAEREIARRVEAEVEVDNKNIVLRADPGTILPVAARAADEPREEPAAAAEEPKQELATDSVQIEEAAPEAPADSHVETPAFTEAERTVTDEAAEEIVAADDTIDAIEEGFAVSDALPAETVQPVETVAEAVIAPAGEVEVDTWSPEDAAAFFDGPATAPAETGQSDISSVAAKLQRIRAVVDQDEPTSGEDEETGFSEDEHAEDFLADAHEDIEAALAIDDEAELASEPARVEAEEAQLDVKQKEETPVDALDDTKDEALAEPDAGWGEQEYAYEEDAYEEDISEEVNDEISALLDRFGVEAEDESADVETGDAAFNSEPADEDIASGEDIVDEAVEDAANEAAEQDAPVRARVIKMKRADFEAAVAAGTLDEDVSGDEYTAFDDADEAASDSSLSADEEADLLRELAAVEAELDGVTDANQDDLDEMIVATDDVETQVEDALEETLAQFEDEDENAFDTSEDPDGPVDLSAYASDDDFDAAGKDSIFAEVDDEVADDAPKPETERVTTRFSEDADDDMARMFDKAANQMDEETGKGRRNAIAHLRAAVAAAKAEENAGGNLKGEGLDTEVYRDDLASVVRPRRPDGAQTRPHTRRPETRRPAPLKLVAEQRVDVDEEHPSQPIRPRRVAMQRPEVAADTDAGSDFAEYAEDVGANTLPELLEAAAAYLSFVEGQEQFSRPQLMTQIRQVEPEDFSREDGLRSFGQLLREGKIEKLEGGRFKAADSISFRPDTRAANG
ncbi:chemotaxis protein CheA [Alisedimentitalea sp. MJ-SS2]|uniref:chemotaxis protein CheA n=1 Tax=Aliisedimentitalea sp. MJ-SS2 TaxID=3049795 RepID=UPI002913E987|nr:chemotaxis protein CheA [Alisedimentitalea sp. MJ-SS2]MDU8927531.1 chemotaxis protein CheA [Alisedimentitalea sp. MJ-SS2]